MIGELEYVRWDQSSQSWHEYKINIFDKKYLSITKNSDDWYAYGISIKSKNSKYSEVHTDYICTIRTGGIVAMRGL